MGYTALLPSRYIPGERPTQRGEWGVAQRGKWGVAQRGEWGMALAGESQVASAGERQLLANSPASTRGLPVAQRAGRRCPWHFGGRPPHIGTSRCSAYPRCQRTSGRARRSTAGTGPARFQRITARCNNDELQALRGTRDRRVWLRTHPHTGGRDFRSGELHGLEDLHGGDECSHAARFGRVELERNVEQVRRTLPGNDSQGVWSAERCTLHVSSSLALCRERCIDVICVFGKVLAAISSSQTKARHNPWVLCKGSCEATSRMQGELYIHAY